MQSAHDEFLVFLQSLSDENLNYLLDYNLAKLVKKKECDAKFSRLLSRQDVINFEYRRRMQGSNFSLPLDRSSFQILKSETFINQVRQMKIKGNFIDSGQLFVKKMEEIVFQMGGLLSNVEEDQLEIIERHFKGLNICL